MTEFLLYGKAFVFAVGSVLCYAKLLNAPNRSILPSSLLAGCGYVLYLAILTGFQSEFAAFFFSTLLVAAGGELLARIEKMPSTIFVLPSIIPLVPGLGLYRTMLMLIQRDYSEGAAVGVRTVLNFGTMAVAIASMNVFARYIFRPRIKKNPPKEDKSA